MLKISRANQKASPFWPHRKSMGFGRNLPTQRQDEAFFIFLAADSRSVRPPRDEKPPVISRLLRKRTFSFRITAGTRTSLSGGTRRRRTRLPISLNDAESSKTVVSGDSAGGGLAISTLIAVRDRHLPLCAGIAALSPWADLTCSVESIMSRAL
jgi:hypothetical protein